MVLGKPPALGHTIWLGMAQPIASQVAGRSRPRQPGSTPRPLRDVGLGGVGLWELVTKTAMFGPLLGQS